MLQDPPQPARNSEEQVLARVFQSESVRFADQLRIPQFGIIHLLLWTTVTAVLLKIELALWDNQFSKFPSAIVELVRVWMIVGTVLAASQLVGAGVLIRAKCYTMLRRLQPGHWLVVVFAFQCVLGFSAWLILILTRTSLVQAPGTSSAAGALVGVAEAAAFVLAAVMLRDARRWRTLLAAEALGECSRAIVGLSSFALQLSGHPFIFPSIVSHLSTYWAVFIVILLVAAVILDHARWASRDWVHWLGVFCLGLVCALAVAWPIAERLATKFL